MLAKRIIVCLDVRNGQVTKGVKFQGNVDVGDPVELAALYYEEGADELIFYDITASHEKRGIFIDVVRRVAERIFIPFTVGGGLRTLSDMREVLLAGAEKVLIRSNALKTLRAKKFPQARFRSTSIERSGSLVRIAGVLELAGNSGDQTVEVEVSDDSVLGTASVRHGDFGIKQYSMLMGAMKVADEVRVTLSATMPRQDA